MSEREGLKITLSRNSLRENYRTCLKKNFVCVWLRMKEKKGEFAEKSESKTPFFWNFPPGGSRLERGPALISRRKVNKDMRENFYLSILNTSVLDISMFAHPIVSCFER